jgi:hypothetical protein
MGDQLKLTRMRVLRRAAELTKNFHIKPKKEILLSLFKLRDEFFGKSKDQRMPSGDATAPYTFPPRVIL